MKSLSKSGGSKGLNYIPSPCTVPTKSIRSRLRRIFKGPAAQSLQKHPVYRDEKKYHHVPKHAASSFLNSTTTGTMIDIQNLDHYEPHWNDKLLVDAVEAEHHRQRRSLI
jgi:hypothetical protein